MISRRTRKLNIKIELVEIIVNSKTNTNININTSTITDTYIIHILNIGYNKGEYVPT